jgi:hypothetical protein
VQVSWLKTQRFRPVWWWASWEYVHATGAGCSGGGGGTSWTRSERAMLQKFAGDAEITFLKLNASICWRSQVQVPLYFSVFFLWILVHRGVSGPIFWAQFGLGLHTLSSAFTGFKNSLNKLGLSWAWAPALLNKWKIRAWAWDRPTYRYWVKKN